MDTNEPVVSQNNGTDTSLVLEKKVPIMDASTTKPDINGDTEMEVDASISQDVINDSSLNVKQDKNNGETTSEPENSLSEDTKISDESLTESENALFPDFLGFDSENAISNDSIPYLNHIKNYLKNNEIVKKTKQTIPDVKTENIVFDTSLGKGKRSRIPNKRYESESMSSFVREDGGRHEHENETQDLSSMSMEISSPAGRGKYGGKSKKPIYTVDMTNPNFLIPFEHGWKRELVYRSTYDSNNRRNGDVYYYMPGGKKIRSMRELIEYLEAQQSNLKSEYFTFFKEPVGVNDTEKEIVRNAKMKGGSGIQRKTQRTPKATQKTVTPTLTPESARAGKSPRYGGFKVKLGSRPSPAAQKNDRKRSLADNELEMGMLPPSWSPKRGSASKQTGWQAKNQREPSPPKSSRKSSRKSAIQTAPVPSSKPDAANLHMQNYLQNVSYGYQTLMHVFQYLKVQDLLRAGCVCTLWRDIASHPSLWRTVRMKNSQVANWDGLAKALTKFRTENLDLRKMLLPGDTDAMWPVFSQAITSIGSLKRIELCKCPASIIEELGNLNGNLQVINAVTIKSDKLDMTSLANLLNLQELRLKSTNGFIIRPNLSALTALKKLKHLSLTSVKDLNKQDIDVIGQLTTLESLDLGECTDFPENFGKDVLLKLVKLEKLRLEKGQGTCSTFNILEAVSKLPTLEQLEMVNFDVKAGFDRALGACTNIKKLLIIPTYISQSATTNHMVLGGVITLKSTLSHFVWGVTLELLRVTELFVDQCEDSPNKKEKKPPGSGGDSIPVLKPVPIMKYNETEEEKSSNDPPQVEILPLPTLQKLLLNCLPNTRVKILKIPFHATWRQSIVDTVN